MPRQRRPTPFPITSRHLSELPIFGSVSTAALDALVAMGTARAAEPGGVLQSEGRSSESLFLVLEGQVKMTRYTPGGKTLILALFGPGELFGVANAFGRSLCRTSQIAVTAVRCLEITRSELFGLFERQPSLVSELLPVLTHHVMECGNCLVETSCARVEPRFAQLFVRLADRLGEVRDGATFVPLALSRQELADLTGTTIETAIRTMSRWGKEGVVLTEETGFLIPDPAVLDQIVLGS